MNKVKNFDVTDDIEDDDDDDTEENQFEGPKEKYDTIEDTLKGVESFVLSHKNQPGDFVGFKIDVYLGRGMFTFKLDNEESKALSRVHSLKKQLEEAEKKLATVRENKSKKRKEK